MHTIKKVDKSNSYNEIPIAKNKTKITSTQSSYFTDKEPLSPNPANTEILNNDSNSKNKISSNNIKMMSKSVENIIADYKDNFSITTQELAKYIVTAYNNKNYNNFFDITDLTTMLDPTHLRFQNKLQLWINLELNLDKPVLTIGKKNGFKNSNDGLCQYITYMNIKHDAIKQELLNTNISDDKKSELKLELDKIKQWLHQDTTKTVNIDLEHVNRHIANDNYSKEILSLRQDLSKKRNLYRTSMLWLKNPTNKLIQLINSVNFLEHSKLKIDLIINTNGESHSIYISVTKKCFNNNSYLVITAHDSNNINSDSLSDYKKLYIPGETIHDKYSNMVESVIWDDRYIEDGATHGSLVVWEDKQKIDNLNILIDRIKPKVQDDDILNNFNIIDDLKNDEVYEYLNRLLESDYEIKIKTLNHDDKNDCTLSMHIIKTRHQGSIKILIQILNTLDPKDQVKVLQHKISEKLTLKEYIKRDNILNNLFIENLQKDNEIDDLPPGF